MVRVRILGSGDAFNSAGALHSCYMLEHEGGTMMLDCGPPCLAAMKRAGVDTDAPDALLISHLHGDHFGGIPFLMLEYSFMTKRKRPLVIAGPPTTEERVRALDRALYLDLQGERKLDFDIDYVVVERDSKFELAGFQVEAFEVLHPAHPFSLGYRISAGGRSILYSGDSAWTDAFVERSRGTDLFLCECCSMKHVSDIHTSYSDIVEHRHELHCKRLILTHLGQDVRADAGVTVDRAEDGMLIEL